MRLAELFGAPSLQDDMIRSGLVSTIFTCQNFIIIHKKTSAISWGPVVPIRFSSNCGDVAMPVCQAATLSRSLLLTFQAATFSVPKQQLCTALNLVPTATFSSFYTLLAASHSIFLFIFQPNWELLGTFPILSSPAVPMSSAKSNSGSTSNVFPATSRAPLAEAKVRTSRVQASPSKDKACSH